MAAGSVIAFWLVAVVLIAVPGPDWAFAIAAGLRRQALPGAVGIVLGYSVLTAVVTAGLGLLVTASPAALGVLTVAGGLSLTLLGIRTVRHPAILDAPAAEWSARRATVWQGAAVSGLNPKGLLVFVALLPQFATPAAPWPVPVQLAVLGAAFTLTCGLVYLAVGAGAATLLRTRPGAARAVSRASGASMVVLGVLLLVEHLVSGATP